MMGPVGYTISIILGLFIFRKYRERKWGSLTDDSSMEGKVVIITGANSGLGKETTIELAKRKATVIMACRDIEKVADAIVQIRTESTTNGELIPMHLDLASLESVRSFAKEVRDRYSRVDVLINNAGVYVPMERKMKTIDGFEIHFGVNHLGHFLLTNLIMDNLKAAAPTSRVVVVSSMLHERGRLDWDNLNCEKGWDKSLRNAGYSNSKLANVVFGDALSRRLESSNVGVYTCCPGFVMTNLHRHTQIKWYQYLFLLPVMLIYMKTAKQGAQTILHCAIAAELRGETGKFYRNCVRYTSKVKMKECMSEKLWTISEKLVGLKE